MCFDGMRTRAAVVDPVLTEQHTEVEDLVVRIFLMPGMSGSDLVDKLRVQNSNFLSSSGRLHIR